MMKSIRFVELDILKKKRCGLKGVAAEAVGAGRGNEDVNKLVHDLLF